MKDYLRVFGYTLLAFLVLGIYTVLVPFLISTSSDTGVLLGILIIIIGISVAITVVYKKYLRGKNDKS
jgi:apolipoprotein N-acyltransferase